MEAFTESLISVKLSSLKLFYQYATDVKKLITVQNSSFVLTLSRA